MLQENNNSIFAENIRRQVPSKNLFLQQKENFFHLSMIQNVLDPAGPAMQIKPRGTE